MLVHCVGCDIVQVGFIFFLAGRSSVCMIFKESFRDQRWAWEESVKAEKRDRDAERERELHLYLSSPLLHFLLTLTFGL